MPGEHHRDEHAGDVVGAEARGAVLVLDRHEDVEQVAVLLLRRRAPAARPSMIACTSSTRPSRAAVAHAEALDVGVRVDVGEGIRALLEVVVQVREAAVELLAEALADEAGGRRVDRQLGEPVEQVDLAALGRASRHAVHLGGDRGGVAAHELVAQGLVVERLPTLLRVGVEHDALAEDRRHERVGLGLVEVLVGRPEEDLVGVGSGEEHDVAVGQAEHARRHRTRRGCAPSARSDRRAAPRGARCRRGHLPPTREAAARCRRWS